MKKPAERKAGEYTAGQIIKAWSPFAILTVFVSVWTIKGVKEALGVATIKFDWPMLHNLVQKAAPIVSEPTPYAAVFKIDLLGAVGTVNPVCFHRFRRLAENETFRSRRHFL